MLKNLLVCALSIFLLEGTLLAQALQPVEIATTHIRENLKAFNINAADIADFGVSDHYLSKHNGVTHVYLVQQYEGIPVHNALINVNILQNGEILNYGSRFEKDLASKVNTTTPQLTMEEAIASLMAHYGIENDASFNIKERISDREAIFDHTGFALEPIPVKLMYQPMPDKTVRLVWNVTYLNLDAQNWWNARIDATNGQLLDVNDYIISCDFGPNEECAEEIDHSTHAHSYAFGPRKKAQPKTEMSPTNMVGTYNVFPLTVESPNHGTRAIVTDPDDPIASPYGWHDTNGQDGAEFTITRGNNVHAYHDIFSFNESNGDEPDGGPSLNFDFELNLSDNTPYAYLDAATTNLFYWNNLMHDIWYQYGFDEASGNFQENNYGNGGSGGDSVNAEALDGSGTNNANFGTPPEGGNPRMQMFLWGGSLPNFDANLFVTAPEDIAGTYTFAQGSFGGDLVPIESEVVLADDGEGVTSDACEPIINGADLEGKIALIDRGDCEFGFKCLAAENEGAVAAIICNNVPGDGLVQMAPGVVGDQVTIPSIFMTFEDCEVLKTGLPGLTIAIEEFNFEVPLPGPTGLDSDYDNVVIAHEYTHGISIRLTGGPSNSSCLTNFEQAGEGWSDWFGIVLTTDASNTANQRRGVGTYLINQPTTGTGIRTFPYTRDMNINPHTYANINNESVPHGVGSVFAATIWDLYWNLVDVHGFDEDMYNGTGGNNIAMQLVLDGLKLQPCNPNFLEARDAIIAADEANYEGENVCLIWETFARRGIGVNATPGGGEDFEVPLLCLQALSVEKSAIGEAVAGGVLTYQLEITNTRAEGVADAVITDDLPTGTTFIEGSSDCSVSESGGVLTFSVGDLAADETIICTYQVQIDQTPFSSVELADDAEFGTDNWNFLSPTGPAIWINTTNNANSGTSSFFAFNTESSSDQLMILEDPIVLDGPNPALSFYHWYNTEAEWDGGVVEVSLDGTTWTDLGPDMVFNGYNITLNDNPASPISGRPAFSGNSGGFIQTIIDLSDFSEQEVQVRFRLGCDGAVAVEGWYVDDIQFFDNLYSITNVACVDDQGTERCSEVTSVVNEGVSSTNDLAKDAFAVALFPNPTTDVFTLQISDIDLGKVDLTITAIDGKTLLTQRFDSFNTTQIDMSAYGAGIYFVELRSDEGTVVKRVVVE